MPDPEFPDSEGRLGLKAEWNGYNTEEWQPCSLTPVSVWSAVRLHQKAVPACRSPSLRKEAAAHFPHHQKYAHTEAPPAAWYQTPDRKDFPHRKPWAADP